MAPWMPSSDHAAGLFCPTPMRPIAHFDDSDITAALLLDGPDVSARSTPVIHEAVSQNLLQGQISQIRSEMNRILHRGHAATSYTSQYDMSRESQPFGTITRPTSTASNLNPAAGDFTPRANTPVDAASERFRSVNQILCKALAEERQAHKTTRAALQAENDKRTNVENEVKSLIKTNSSLAATAQMLGGIVKHNMDCSNTESAPSEIGSSTFGRGHNRDQIKNTAILPTRLETEPVITTGGNAVHTAKSILYDVVEQQKAQYIKMGYPEGSEEGFDNDTPASNEIDGSDGKRGPFDLVSLQSTNPDHTSASPEMSYNLRRQFLDKSEVGGLDEHLFSTAKGKDKPIKPVGVQIRDTLESAAKDALAEKMVKNTKPVPCRFFQRGSCQAGDKCTFSHALAAASDAVCRYYTKGDCKFGESCALIHDLGARQDIDMGDTGMSNVIPGSTAKPGLEATEVSTTPPSQAIGSPGKATIPTDISRPWPYQLRIKWAIERNRPVFDDDRDVDVARRISGTPYSPFWQHPVRYMPESTDKNLHRTLMIDFLPLNTTIKDVLALIRGGALESIQLFPPIGNATDFVTARIVFHYEIPAIDMQVYWVKYGFKVHGQSIRVLLAVAPTYPKNRQLDEDVFMHCYTRLLLIDNVKDSIIRLLPQVLHKQIEMGFVVEIGQAIDGIPMVEFTSVVEAVKAMKQLQTEEAFHGAVFDYEDDYCQEGAY